MKRTRFAIVIVGWLLVLGGFGWIVQYSVIKVHQHFQFRKELSFFRPNYDAMPKDELLELYRKTKEVSLRVIDENYRRRRQTLWAGLLMLSGAVLLQLASINIGRDPNKPVGPY